MAVAKRAIGLSWRKRADDPEYKIDVPLVRFNGGRANILFDSLPDFTGLIFSADAWRQRFALIPGYNCLCLLLLVDFNRC